ncbi:MAG: NUDIX hydrolase, partial [Bosea sp.]|nr:NUDIX hydrolase [Bosea sp. (in: a-proteobacteria)]
MSDHTVTLTQAERARTATNLRPVDAATMLILDYSGRKPRVLMGKRHPSHKFMPGKYVFPCEQRLAARCVRPSAQRGRALALAAIRETFEETGLLFGSAEYGAPENPPPGVWSEFAAKGIFPDLGAVTFVARAITPPRRPKRFDTRFFTVDASAVAG